MFHTIVIGNLVLFMICCAPHRSNDFPFDQTRPIIIVACFETRVNALNVSHNLWVIRSTGLPNERLLLPYWGTENFINCIDQIKVSNRAEILTLRPGQEQKVKARYRPTIRKLSMHHTCQPEIKHSTFSPPSLLFNQTESQIDAWSALLGHHRRQNLPRSFIVQEH